MQKIKTFKELVNFLTDRYPNYKVVEYPEVETRVRAIQVGEDSSGNAIAEQEQYQEHIYDNLGFINTKTKIEEITLVNQGLNSFRGFKNHSEIVKFLDKNLDRNCYYD